MRRPTIAFQLKPRCGYHATGASILEKKSSVDFHSFSPMANEKEKFMKEVSGIGRPEISLYRSKTQLLTVPFCQGSQRMKIDHSSWS
ncbi:hypothetical protein CHARACLAT_020875 [Characodon lateralis]|uniref:Uncharacterized protein n=1 Tax=Characodon lateralis TaxID=208331 RepID=A0ABU7EBG7_9TELE|nr:hypothetical protein [Characodon lateralis]